MNAERVQGRESRVQSRKVEMFVSDCGIRISFL
jgi:hypothetical protein